MSDERDLLASHRQKAIEKCRQKAEELLREGQREAAAAAYEAAHKLMLQFAEDAPSRQLEYGRKKEALALREKARNLRAGVTAEAPARVEERGHELRAAVMQFLYTAPITWAEIGGLAQTKREIKYALGMTLAAQPPGVILSPWRNILFYGPPGTGKTLLAAATSSAIQTPAVAEALRSVFFNVKVSSVMSKYFGESSKIISELYGTARDASPAVIFLDEFESLTPSRDQESSSAERRILSTLLAELDGLAEKGRQDVYVLTIAATNRPWDIDAAILSRFEKKILIPLPDREARREILTIHLSKRGLATDVSYDELVEMTERYSGRELERFAKEATGRMIAQVNRQLPELVDQGLHRLRDYTLRLRPLLREDFGFAAAGIAPQTTVEEMDRYHRWQERVTR